MGFLDILLGVIILGGSVYLLYRRLFSRKNPCSGCNGCSCKFNQKN